jgi:hypothetical protein
MNKCTVDNTPAGYTNAHNILECPYDPKRNDIYILHRITIDMIILLIYRQMTSVRVLVTAHLALRGANMDVDGVVN